MAAAASAAKDKGTSTPASIQQPASTLRVLLALIALRLANAFLIQTFFQPDEYYQSLEPAWQIAFGDDSGALVTWVCHWHDHSRAVLMIRKGMEAAITVISAPLSLRRSLQVGCRSGDAAPSERARSRRALTGRAQSTPSTHRRVDGLLCMVAQRRNSRWPAARCKSGNSTCGMIRSEALYH